MFCCTEAVGAGRRYGHRRRQRAFSVPRPARQTSGRHRHQGNTWSVSPRNMCNYLTNNIYFSENGREFKLRMIVQLSSQLSSYKLDIYRLLYDKKRGNLKCSVFNRTLATYPLPTCHLHPHPVHLTGRQKAQGQSTCGGHISIYCFQISAIEVCVLHFRILLIDPLIIL